MINTITHILNNSTESWKVHYREDTLKDVPVTQLVEY